MDEALQPEEGVGFRRVGGDDLETLGGELAHQLRGMEEAEDSFLPQAVVDMQRALASLSDDGLMHVIVGAAVQIASREAGMLSPGDVLAAALSRATEGFSSTRWTEEVQPEVRRIATAARERDVEADGELLPWAVGELRTLAVELRRPRPADDPALSDALRLLADMLDGKSP